MQHSQLIQQLRTLRVPGMVEALEQQLTQPSTHSALSFEERLALMIDRETTHRSNNKVERLLKAAKLKQQAYPEDIDYTHARGLDKGVFASLLSGQWINEHQNVLLTSQSGLSELSPLQPQSVRSAISRSASIALLLSDNRITE